MSGFITQDLGNAALAAPGQNAPTSAYPSSVWDYTPWMEDTTRLARSIGDSQAAYGTIDEYGRQVGAPEPAMPAAEAQAKYGIPGELDFPNDIPESVAADRYQAKREELARQDAASRSSAGLLTRLGAGLATTAADPLNIAAAFVPGVEEARVMGVLARAGIEGTAGRLAARAITGDINATLGQIPLTGLRYGLAQQEGEDYSATNAMADLLMGGAFGAGLHTAIGGVADLIGRAWRESPASVLADDDPNAREDLARAAVAQAAQGQPVNLAPVLDTTATRSGFAARLAARGDTGEGNYAAYTPQGMRVELRPEVVDAGDLTASNLDTGEINPAYPPERQPRDRTSAASQAQIMEMASRLEPERLGPSPEVSTGAPIADSNGIIESGNGRILALRRVYSDPALTDQAAAYRAFLEARGHDLTGMQAPILIGRRVTELTPEQTADFVRAANERATLGMSAAEQARADATRAGKAIGDYQRAPLSSSANKKFVAGFMAQIPAEERGPMVLANGDLSTAGETRIRSALLAHAYGDALGPTLEKMLNGDVEHMKAVAGALADAAGMWSRLRAAVAAGEIPASLDITPAIGEAVQLLDRAKSSGTPIADLLAQSDMIGGPSPAARGLLALMFKDERMRVSVARKDIAAMLDRYVQQALEAKPGPGLFGEAETSPADVLRTVMAGDARGETAATGLETAPQELHPDRPRPLEDVKGDKGEYVTAEGSPNLGAINETIAKAIGEDAGPIRLTERAETHIAERQQQLDAHGYASPLDLVRDVAANFDEIWRAGGNSLMLVKRVQTAGKDYAPSLYVLLQPASDGHAWEVQSGGVFRAAYPEGAGRELLWQGERTAQTGTGDQVPLATSPGEQAGPEERHSAGRQSETDIGAREAGAKPEPENDARQAGLFGEEAPAPLAKPPPELTAEIDRLEAELQERLSADTLDPEAETELARIAEDDAKQQSVLSGIAQAATCLLGGLGA